MLPSSPARRVVGLDVARCLALLGMIATHTLVSRDAEGDVTWVQQLAGGRSSALFAVLAGVSIALMTGRTAPVRGRDRRSAAAGLTVRALIIAAIGLVLELLGSGIAVILTYYGVLFLLGLPFLGLRARALVGLGTLCALAAPVFSYLLKLSCHKSYV